MQSLRSFACRWWAVNEVFGDKPRKTFMPEGKIVRRHRIYITLDSKLRFKAENPTRLCSYGMGWRTICKQYY